MVTALYKATILQTFYKLFIFYISIYIYISVFAKLFKAQFKFCSHLPLSPDYHGHYHEELKGHDF